MMFKTLSILSIGLSTVGGTALMAAYVLSPKFPKKNFYSITSAIGLTACLSGLQFFHYNFFLHDLAPLNHWQYLAFLFAAPALFFYFFRAIILPDEPFQTRLLLLLALLLLPLLLPLGIALPLLFSVGVLFAMWIARLVYRLRSQRKQHQFELVFSVVIVLLAVGVLILGSLLTWLNPRYFYTFYSLGIGLAYIMVLFALVAIPDFVDQLFEVVRAKYSTSTLGGVNVASCLKRLETLMSEERLYSEESLNLSTLASAVGISSHQLSELINTRLGSSFSNYVKQQRLAAAKDLLKQAPKQSILSISIETGFKSQSTFYAAFKEDTGQSPGEFRKAHSD